MYDTLWLSITYADTTIHVIRCTTLQTYQLVGSGVVIGTALGEEPGVLIGVMLGIAVDEWL